MIILTHLPLVWRWRLSVAAAADDIFGNPLRGLRGGGHRQRISVGSGGCGAPLARSSSEPAWTGTSAS